MRDIDKKFPGGKLAIPPVIADIFRQNSKVISKNSDQVTSSPTNFSVKNGYSYLLVTIFRFNKI